MAGKPPNRKGEMAKALMQKHGGGLSDAQISSILEQKGQRVEGASSVPASVFEDDPGCIDAAEHFLPQDDCQEFQPALQKLRVRAKPIAAEGASSATGVVNCRGQRVHPQVKGCSLQRESTWHHLMFCASHLSRTSAGLKSHKRTYYDNVESEEAVLRQCLLWLWAVHAQETGDECPWDF